VADDVPRAASDGTGVSLRAHEAADTRVNTTTDNPKALFILGAS
jgi:hypothetical protein